MRLSTVVRCKDLAVSITHKRRVYATHEVRRAGVDLKREGLAGGADLYCDGVDASTFKRTVSVVFRCLSVLLERHKDVDKSAPPNTIVIDRERLTFRMR